MSNNKQDALGIWGSMVDALIPGANMRETIEQTRHEETLQERGLPTDPVEIMQYIENHLRSSLQNFVGRRNDQSFRDEVLLAVDRVLSQFRIRRDADLVSIEVDELTGISTINFDQDQLFQLLTQNQFESYLSRRYVLDGRTPRFAKDMREFFEMTGGHPTLSIGHTKYAGGLIEVSTVFQTSAYPNAESLHMGRGPVLFETLIWDNSEDAIFNDLWDHLEIYPSEPCGRYRSLEAAENHHLELCEKIESWLDTIPSFFRLMIRRQSQLQGLSVWGEKLEEALFQ